LLFIQQDIPTDLHHNNTRVRRFGFPQCLIQILWHKIWGMKFSGKGRGKFVSNYAWGCIFPANKNFIVITKSIRNPMTPTLQLGWQQWNGKGGVAFVILITHMLIPNISIIFIYRLYWTLPRMQTHGHNNRRSLGWSSYQITHTPSSIWSTGEVGNYCQIY